MDFTGIYKHLPSSVAGVVVFAIGGAVYAGWMTQEQATIAVSVIIGLAGLFYKHQDL